LGETLQPWPAFQELARRIAKWQSRLSDLSRLEQYLSGQLAETLLDSSGTFTMARERAVEKLAAFQLPRPASWILKLIQGLIAGGTDSIRIALRACESELVFGLPRPWSLEELEDAFWNPEITADPALDHLKRGLWNVAIRQQRPFQFSLPGWKQALIWTGQELRQFPIAAESLGTLTISCQPAQEIRRNAPQINAEILQEIQRYAFVCPVPLTVDGRRMDALQAGPQQGYGPSTLPFFIATATSTLKRLSLPPGTWEGHNPEVVAEGQPKNLGRRKMGARGPVCAAAVLAVHRHRDLEGRWKFNNISSNFYWVRDGVVVLVEELSLPALSVSCGVFASAEGIPTDLTGFKPTDAQELSRRRTTACAALKDIWVCGKWSLDYLYMGSMSQDYRSLGGLLRWLVLRFKSAYSSQSPEYLYQNHKIDMETLKEKWGQAAALKSYNP